jgi:hypothetical protein
MGRYISRATHTKAIIYFFYPCFLYDKYIIMKIHAGINTCVNCGVSNDNPIAKPTITSKISIIHILITSFLLRLNNTNVGFKKNQVLLKI